MMQHLWFPFIFPCFFRPEFPSWDYYPTRKLTQAANANASAVLNVVAEVGSSVWGVGKMCVAFSFVDMLFDCLIQPFPKHEKTTQWNMHLRKISLCYLEWLLFFFKLHLSSRLGNWCIKVKVYTWESSMVKSKRTTGIFWSPSHGGLDDSDELTIWRKFSGEKSEVLSFP